MEVKLTRVKFWMIVCHVTSALGTLRSEVTLLQLLPSSDASSVERGIVEGKNGNLVKNLPTDERDWGGKPEDH